MRIGWDLDGVNYGFIEGCNDIRRSQGEPEFTPGVWYFYREVGMTDEDWVAWCHKAADDGLLFNHPPLPGAVDAFRRVKRLGHTNVVITDRAFGRTPQVSQKITTGWLNTERFEYDELYFDKDKTKYDVDMMVEDKLENYDALIDAGVDAYLIDRPWNQITGGDARKRISDVSEFADMVALVTEQGYADLSLV
jgi:hypothetical protein